MRRRWLLLLLLLFAYLPAQAQAASWTSGCDPAAVDAIAATTAQLDFTAACQTYQQCLAESDFAACELQTLITLEANCADDLCLLRSRLYTAALGLPNPAYANPFTLESANALPDILIAALTYFEAGDYAAALAAYQSITVDISYHPLVPLSLGLVSEAAGDVDTARHYYDRGLAQTVGYPLAHYLRGAFLARAGFAAEAAGDFANLQHYASAPFTQAVAEVLVTEYPIDQINFEPWLLYPVTSRGGGSGGAWQYDESLDPAIPIQLALISDGTRLITMGLGQYLDNPPPYLSFAPLDDGGFSYRQAYIDDYGEWGTTISLNLGQVPVHVLEDAQGFEGNATTHYLIAPADQPDPRLTFVVQRCEGGVISRLSVGEAAGSASYSGTELYAEPGGQTTGQFTEMFDSLNVLEGPECINGQAWWRVSSVTDDTLSGWAPENDGNSYLLLNDASSAIPEMAAQP